MVKFLCFFFSAISFSYAQPLSKECFNKAGVPDEEANSEYCVVGKKVFRIDEIVYGRTDTVESYIDTVNAYYTGINKLKFMKVYNKQGYLDGNYMEVFPNGKIKERGLHKEGRKLGYIVSYYPSGKKRSTLQYLPEPERVSEWHETNFKILDYWDSTGNQIVAKGEGMCKCSLVSGRIEVGRVHGGIRDSIWSEYSRDSLVLTEQYANGEMIEGVRYHEGKPFKYTTFESTAEYVGGMNAMAEVIRKNLIYPVAARRLGIEGSVFISFVVLQDGSISNPTVVKGIHPECDRESIRVVKLLKQWYPARLRGKPVKGKYVFPVKYKLG